MIILDDYKTQIRWLLNILLFIFAINGWWIWLIIVSILGIIYFDLFIEVVIYTMIFSGLFLSVGEDMDFWPITWSLIGLLLSVFIKSKIR
jgi:hypothetical protein